MSGKKIFQKFGEGEKERTERSQSIPARSFASAFYLEWADASKRWGEFMDETEFIIFNASALCDVLRADTAICLESFDVPDASSENPVFGYRVIYIKDDNGKLRDKYPEIRVGMEMVKGEKKIKYFSEVFDHGLHTHFDPQPGVAPDVYMPMSHMIRKGGMAVPSFMILIDDTKDELSVEIKSVISGLVMAIRKQQGAIKGE